MMRSTGRQLLLVAARWTSTTITRNTSVLSTSQAHVLDSWIKNSTETGIVYADTDHISKTKVRDLHYTLPFTISRQESPSSETSFKAFDKGNPLSYGQHLIFFHHAEKEEELSLDKSDSRCSPPPPFTRRMWASGSFFWSKSRNLQVDKSYFVIDKVVKIEKKSFDTPSPKVFVHRKIVYTSPEENNVPIMEELRTHVHLLGKSNVNEDGRIIRQVPNLPTPQFSFSWIPTPTTLFRFSALTFNAHLIHLDRDYALKEGYSERLVHGPLTALMLLEALRLGYPAGIHLQSFRYRAYNPVVVNKRQTIHRATNDDGKTVILWAVDDDDVVGMTAEATLF